MTAGGPDACVLGVDSGGSGLRVALGSAGTGGQVITATCAEPVRTGPSGIDAAHLLAQAIAADKRLVIVADYDCDGATACAVGVRGLRLLGARHVDYLVPDRVADGYGLSAPIARRVKERGADVLITVDNGIASVDGVAEAKALGLSVLVTDHHLPGDTLPDALAIVNPNQPGCGFPSKNLAGVGVIFYMMLALRA
ncbi:MAG TPA: hypothetical protein DD420_04385, partial [Streptomyces sp.]|nr:hypothetical protein [Streptomyces sp.]